MLKISAFLLLSLSISPAFARLQLLPDLFSINSGDKKDYQLGDVWGKKRVAEENLKNESMVFNRAARATAYLPTGGTGFYLGKFAGKHILATNHHVCPIEADCVGTLASFNLLNKSFMMKKLLITIPTVDLSLLVIDIKPADEKSMLKVARNFSFSKEISKGLELLTVGYGIGNNPNDYMMANQDSDCKVFSTSDDFKLLADPDELNPAAYKAWSFAHSCDISHGDSGSAMVDRKTGDVVGILWTGKIPKSKIVQKSSNLLKIFESSSPLIWSELSYAVPALKIGDFLRHSLEDSQLEEKTKEIFKAILK